MTTTCNECGKTFEITPKDIITAEMEGLEIQHFPCPLCGQKYVVFAADEDGSPEAKRAVTHYEVLDTGDARDIGPASLLRIQPLRRPPRLPKRANRSKHPTITFSPKVFLP